MIYPKRIPSIPDVIWGWSYTSPEDAQDSMETFMVDKWTE